MFGNPSELQAWGKQARHSLADLVTDQTVTVDEVDTDKYGRTVAHITVDGMDVGEMLVRHGHAWQFIRYSHDAHLAKLQEEAQADHTGLWSQPGPIAPWEYRHPEQLLNVLEQPAASTSSPVRVATSNLSCGTKR